MRIFHKKGYYHTTFSDLANACGIEKPHFYYYFKDKKQLMTEVLEFTHTMMKKLVFRYAYDEKLNPKERLRKFADNTLGIYDRFPYGCLVGNTLLQTVHSEPEFTSIMKTYFQDWINSLATIYETSYSKKEAWTLAIHDLEKIQGSIMLSQLYDDSEYLRKALESVNERIK